MLELVDKVPTAQLSRERDELGFAEDAPGLVLWDIFLVHRCKSVLDRLAQTQLQYQVLYLYQVAALVRTMMSVAAVVAMLSEVTTCSTNAMEFSCLLLCLIWED